MGTRGLLGLVVNDTVKATYNHYDSYPSGLGQDVVRDIKSFLDPDAEDDLSALVTLAEKLQVVDEDVPPTAEQIEEFKVYADRGVSTGSLDEWYVLLHRIQGGLSSYLHAGVMVDSSAFALDSLFCEWGYLVNVDNHTLEVYRGFQTDAAKVKGRFAGLETEQAHRGENKYFPISLIATVPFSELTEQTMDRISVEDNVRRSAEYWYGEGHEYPEDYIEALEDAVRLLTDIELPASV